MPIQLNKKTLVIFFILIFLLTACQKQNNSIGSNETVTSSSSLQTESINSDLDEWLVPVLSQYLQDDVEVEPPTPSGIKQVTLNNGKVITVVVENGEFIAEGDINVGNLIATSNAQGLNTQGLVAKTGGYWQGGVIPYVLDENKFKDTNLIEIKLAIQDINNNELISIRFQPRTIENDYVEFVPHDKCWSYLGRKGGGAQPVKIGKYCLYEDILHELGHVIGLDHEHARHDREGFITVYEDRLIDGTNYDQLSNSKNVGDYDFLSLMHYSPYEERTAEARRLNLPAFDVLTDSISIDRIGTATSFSVGDIDAINDLYPNIKCYGITNYGPGGGFFAYQGAPPIDHIYNLTIQNNCDFGIKIFYHFQETNQYDNNSNLHIHSDPRGKYSLSIAPQQNISLIQEYTQRPYRAWELSDNTYQYFYSNLMFHIVGCPSEHEAVYVPPYEFIYTDGRKEIVQYELRPTCNY